MDQQDLIYQKIPHRPPFLWIDRVISLDPETIETEKDILPDLDLFAGHYPGNPIMPGVLLCEAVFQAGAMLIVDKVSPGQGVPVLTRIQGAKFKNMVRPGDTIRVRVKISENIGPAWFMKGKVMVGDKVAVSVDFSCAMAAVESYKTG
ncbi:3-hydroxyacyl-ACP dehydratase FabZ family protein [Thermodesulfobacteriota bacterium]